MAIIGIVAVDMNGAIGRAGNVPWHYSSDLKFFKRQTTGHVCVMGHRTWLSLKRPLPGRLNVVMSRHAEIEGQGGVILLRDKTAVLSLKPYLSCDLYVIGGRQVYETFLNDIEQWVVTEIPLAVEEADTYMPEGYLDGFEPYESEELEEGLKVVFYKKPI